MDRQRQCRAAATDHKIADERTALLPPRTSARREDVEDARRKEEITAREIGQEIVVLIRNSLPIILGYVLQNGMQVGSGIVIGLMAQEALRAAALAYLFATITGWMIALGGTTAIDTLASASFTGSKNPHDLGVILQRAFIVLTVFYIPVVVVWFVSEPLFIAVGQGPDVSRQASHFLMVLAPGGLGYIYFEALKKYLQAQGIMRGGLYVLLIACPGNIYLNYVFVHRLGMGALGAPLATGVSYWLCFVLLLVYTKWFSRSQCWGGWSRASLRNLPTFTRLAFLGVIQIGTEWWTFQLVAVVASKLGTEQFASQGVVMGTNQLVNTIPFGLGIACSSRVGNLLGARDAVGARRAANVASWLSIVFGAIVGIVIWGCSEDYARLFNDNEKVIRVTSTVLPFVALFQIADGISGSCGGALRGQGRQHIGAAVNVLSYGCVALPVGIALAFHGWGLEGLWVGQCIALYMTGPLEWLVVHVSRWEKQVEYAFERMEREGEGEEEEEGREAGAEVREINS